MQSLGALHSEINQAIEGLPQKALDWAPGPGMNSICVLVAHTAGATRYLAGDVATGRDTGRDRPEEFRAEGLDAGALKDQLGGSLTFVHGALKGMDLADWERKRIRGDGQEVLVGWVFLHILDHTAQHSGHVQLTRQLWEQRSA